MLPKPHDILITANSITKIGAKSNFHRGLLVSSEIPFIFLLQLMAGPVAAAKCISIFSYGEIETWEVFNDLFWMMKLMKGHTTALQLVFWF